MSVLRYEVVHEMTKRPDGTGSVTPIVDPKTGEVRHRARGPHSRGRPHIGVFDTEEEANAACDLGLHELQRSKRTSPKTFAEFGAEILDEREHDGIRGVSQERLRWSKHIVPAKFAAMAPEKVKPADIAEWLRAMGRKRADDRRGDRPLSRATISRCLSLASVIFDELGPQGRGLVDSNPCLGMKVKKKESEKATEEPWTFLTEEEQERVSASTGLAAADRCAILFAVGTGLRQGEQFNLELRDLHVDGAEPHVFVRFGSKGKAPKNGKPRRVPLFGLGLEAAREWLKLLPSFCIHNFDRLVFPTMNGHRRGQKPLGNGRFLPAEHGTHVIRSGKPKRSTKGTHVYVDRFELAMRAVGIARNVRWHDLRHTCASSLVGGFWGDAWTLEEVKEMCGHSSITVTQRYAHLGETALKKAARKVRVGQGTAETRVDFPPPGVGPALDRGGPGSTSTLAAIFNESNEVGRAGHDPATYGLKGHELTEALRSLAGKNGATDQRVSHVAATLVAMLEGRGMN